MLSAWKGIVGDVVWDLSLHWGWLHLGGVWSGRGGIGEYVLDMLGGASGLVSVLASNLCQRETQRSGNELLVRAVREFNDLLIDVRQKGLHSKKIKDLIKIHVKIIPTLQVHQEE